MATTGVATSAVGSTWAAFSTSGALDVTLPAAVGDVIELSAGGLWNTGTASFVNMDFATMVSGSPANWVSTGTSANSGGIFGLFQEDANAYAVSSGSQPYTVQAGDIVAGNVTFRLYGKSGSTRSIIASPQPYAWASKCPGVATASMTGNTGAGAYAALGASITLAAAAGDRIQIKANGVVPPSGSIGLFDVATVVSGSPLNWVSTGGSSHSGGVGAWRTMRGDYEPVGGNGMLYTVQSGDVVSGQVTLRMYGYSSGAAFAMDAGSTWYARKVSVASQVIRSTAYPNGLTTTLAAPDTTGAFDISIAAAANDWVEVGYSGLAPNGGGLLLEVMTRVGGSNVNYISTGTGTPVYPAGGYIDPAGPWNSSSIGLAFLYKVQAADLSAGTVTFRLMARAVSGSGTLPATSTDNSAFWCVKR